MAAEMARRRGQLRGSRRAALHLHPAAAGAVEKRADNAPPLCMGKWRLDILAQPRLAQVFRRSSHQQPEHDESAMLQPTEP
jgi:hypothetical protein